MAPGEASKPIPSPPWMSNTFGSKETSPTANRFAFETYRRFRRAERPPSACSAKMKPLESKGVVRGTLKEDGTLLVSFFNHDGYFRATWPSLKERIRRAERDKEEISFSFDRELNILKVFGGPS